MYTSRMTCPSCKVSDDTKMFTRYTLAVKVTMGFTEPELEVVVCPKCGVVFHSKAH